MLDLQSFCVKCLELHYEKNKHPIYLNIKDTPKPKTVEDGQEITRLAIGLEGGATFLHLSEEKNKVDYRYYKKLDINIYNNKKKK